MVTIFLTGVMLAASIAFPLSAAAQISQLDSKDRDYIAQVVSANAAKTNAQFVDLHVKAVRVARSSDMTSDVEHETVLGLPIGHTIVIGEAGNKRYEFRTSSKKVETLTVGDTYAVVIGMGMLDLKHHKINVKGKDSAVFLIPSSGKDPVQLSVMIESIEEQSR
jgi:VCBS repeat-containing protein